MKVAIVGASKGTGLQTVLKALDLGHEVVAVARNPDKLKIQHERLKKAQGDVQNVAQLEKAFSGVDAVISTFGVGFIRGTVTLYSEGIANILAAMQTCGVKRLLALSSSGANPQPRPDSPFWFERIVKPLFLANQYADDLRMETKILASDLDWTIVRPVLLTNSLPRWQYRTAFGYDIAKGWKISRADVADFIVKALDRSDYVHKAIAIAD